MTDELPVQPVDGIVSPPEKEGGAEGSAQTPVLPPKTVKRPLVNPMILVLIVVVALYVLPGLVLTLLFPRPDGSLSGLKFFGTVFYGGFGVLWLLLGALALSRIRLVKDRPRLKFLAMLRLFGVLVPLLLVSAVVPLLINIPPKFSLEVIAPESELALVAPVSVTFGMPRALQYFALQNLQPLRYEWDFLSDDTIDQETFEPQATFTFQRAGVFTVTARVTMASGDTRLLTRRIVIPRASFGVEPGNPIVNEPAIFSLEHLYPKSATTEKPTVEKASWDFDGDGTADFETKQLTASTTFRKVGSVNVSVSLSLTNQTQVSLQRTVEVVEPPEQPFPIMLETQPILLLGPPPFGVVFTLRTQEPIASALWDFGNEKTAEGLRVAQVFTQVGTFSVNATVQSQSGSVARLAKIVRVTNPLQVPDLSFEGTAVKNFTISGEAPLVVDLTPMTSLPLVSFSWDSDGKGEEEVKTEKSFHAVYRDEGRYTVDLIGMDPDQSVFRKRITISVTKAQSFVSFTMDPSNPVAPATVKFDASDTFIPDEDIAGFEWDFGDLRNDATFSGARTEHLFQEAGTFTITLTVRTTSGKSFTDKRTLLVRAPLLDACFLPSRTSGKAPLGVRFDSACSTGAFTSWRWNFGDGSESEEKSPTHVFLEPGEFTVTLSAVTEGGVKSMKSATISVSAP